MSKEAKQKKQRSTSKLNYASAKEGAQRREQMSQGSNRAFRIPKGLTRYQLKDGTQRLDFLPFKVGKGNPSAEEGTYHFERTFFQHGRVGAGNESVICPRKTFGKKCPICEYRAKLSQIDDADEKELRDLSPKHRQLFVVKRPGKDGLMLLESSYFGFGELLDLKLSKAEEGDEYDKFFYLDDGFTVRIACEEESIGRGKFVKAKDIEFKIREEQYEDSLLEDIPCLDDLLIEIPYDELKELFHESSESGKKDNKKPSKPSKKDDEDEDDDDEKPSKPTKPTGKKKPAKDEDDEEDDDDDDDDDLVDEDDEDEDEPKPSKPAGKKKPVKDEDDDDDDESSDDDDEDGDDESESDDDDEADDEDGDDESDDDDDESDDDEPSFDVGDKVSFTYKGEKLTGTISKINAAKKLAHIKVKGKSDPSIVALKELKPGK